MAFGDASREYGIGSGCGSVYRQSISGYEIPARLLYHLGGHSAYNSSAIQALCAEITVGSYLFGEMTQSVLCPSTRLLAKWKDEEMVIGLPFEHFSKTVEGIMATSKTTDTPKRKREISKRYAERRKDNSEGVDENISPEENSRI